MLRPQTHTIATAKQSRYVFIQTFKFILIKMHKNCCHQSCSFCLKYAPNRLSAGALPQTSLGELTALPSLSNWFREWGPQGKGKEGGKGKRKGEEMGGEGKRGSPGMPKSRVGKPIRVSKNQVYLHSG